MEAARLARETPVEMQMSTVATTTPAVIQVLGDVELREKIRSHLGNPPGVPSLYYDSPGWRIFENVAHATSTEEAAVKHNDKQAKEWWETRLSGRKKTVNMAKNLLDAFVEAG